MKHVLLTGAALVAIGGPGAALAQTKADAASEATQAKTNAAPDGGVAEIIVTAQKRSESANKVGMSITAVSGDTLAARGVTSVADLAKIAPSFSATESSTNTPVYQVRGVGFFDSTLASSPAVSIYTDEVALPFPTMTRAIGLDLERVEVLKGPQGTLFGQNSTGGAINYIAAKPTDTFESGGDFSFGRFNRLDMSAFASGPIANGLKARLALGTSQGGDWQRSYTRDATLGARDQLNGRLLLDWEAAPRLTVRVNLNGWIDKGDTTASQLVAVDIQNPANAFPDVANAQPAPKDARAADWTPGFPMRRNDRFGQASVRADYELSDSVNLTSISAYAYLKTESYVDQDATLAVNLDTLDRGTIRTFSQELRLSGSQGPVTWIVGGNYEHDHVRETLTLFTDEASVLEVLPGLQLKEAIGQNTQVMRTYAAFGNLEWRLTDGLKLHGGLRYTQADRSFSGCAVATNQDTITTFEFLQQIFAGSVVPIPLNGCATLNQDFHSGILNQRLDQNNLSWRAGIDYQISPQSLLFASVSQGYKSGSFPTLVASTYVQNLPVTQEGLRAYEAGFKFSAFQRKLQLNGSAFYYDYNDKQIRSKLIDPVFGPVEALVNIPKSRAYGAELEVTARPIKGLDLSAGVTYLNTKVQRYIGVDNSGLVADFAGSRFPFAPKWQAVGDAQYSFAVGNGDTEAFAGAGMTYHSRTSASLGDVPELAIRDYVVLDLRAGLQDTSGKWRAWLWGRNVTNQYYWVNAFRGVDTYARQAALPATYGLAVSFRY